MSKSAKKDLGTLVREIAKKHNIPLSLNKPIVGGGIGPLGGARGVTISAPISRPCGNGIRGSNAYSRSELVKLAKAADIDTKDVDMDYLCAALGINPAASEVQVPAKNCGTSYRGDDRYTRADVVALAKARGIKPTGKTMDELCSELGIEPARQPVAACIPLVLSPEARTFLLEEEKLGYNLSIDQMRERLKRSTMIGSLAGMMSEDEVRDIYNETPDYFIFPKEDTNRINANKNNSDILQAKLQAVRTRIAQGQTPWGRPSSASASAPPMYEEW